MGHNWASIQIIRWTIIKVKPMALGQILYSLGGNKWAPEQNYLSSDQDWSGVERGHYSIRNQINAKSKSAATIRLICGPLLKSGLGLFARYCTHQETIGGAPEQKYLPSDQDWIGLERGHCSRRTGINAGGKNAATFQIIHWTINEVTRSSKTDDDVTISREKLA